MISQIKRILFSSPSTTEPKTAEHTKATKSLKILFTCDIPSWVKNSLEKNHHEVVCIGPEIYMDEARFSNQIKNCDIYVSGGGEYCTKKVMAAASRLKRIIYLGVDYRSSIDVEAAAERKIPILNTPNANARAVAEHTFLLILLSARKGVSMANAVRNRVWGSQTGFELKNKTIGLIGRGAIAIQVAEIARGFGMKVIYWSRSGAKPEMAGEYKNFDEILSQSDIVSLHVPEVSGEIIGEKALSKMKPHASLINTARAKLVNAEALYTALQTNKLASAAFDVFYSEGEKAWNCAEMKLTTLGPDKFILTPHAAWNTQEADDETYKMALNHINMIAN